MTSAVFTEASCRRKTSLPQLLDKVEDEARKCTDLYINNQVNPMISPFMKGGKEMAPAEGFWTWSSELERYFHDDLDTGIRVYFPRIAPSTADGSAPTAEEKP